MLFQSPGTIVRAGEPSPGPRKAWRRIAAAKAFQAVFELSGASLKRPPRGCDPDHPLIGDLKRKDFVAVSAFSEADACAGDLLERFAAIARAGSKFVEFLSRAVGAPF